MTDLERHIENGYHKGIDCGVDLALCKVIDLISDDKFYAQLLTTERPREFMIEEIGKLRGAI